MKNIKDWFMTIGYTVLFIVLLSLSFWWNLWKAKEYSKATGTGIVKSFFIIAR